MPRPLPLHTPPSLPPPIVRYNKDPGAMLVTATTAEITYQFYNTDGILIDDYTVAKELCQLGYQDDSSRFIR